MPNPISIKVTNETIQNAFLTEKIEYERKLIEIKQLLQHNLKCSENEANDYIDYMYGNPDHIQEIIKKIIDIMENDRIEFANSWIVDSPPNQFNINNLGPMMHISTWETMDKPIFLSIYNHIFKFLSIKNENMK